MPPVDEPSPFEPKSRAPEGRRSKASGAAEPRAGADLVTFTVDVESGQVVSIERIDDAGMRRELSEEDRTRLAKAKVEAGATLADLVEQAFQAGIDCMFGQDDEAEPAESSEDAELSRLLLQSLIARSPAQQLLQGEVLQRALVGSLIAYAANGRGGPPEGAVAH